jgi:hypothetical protein
MGAGGLTLAGLAGYAWPHDTQSASAANIPTAPVAPPDARGVLHFVTRPDLTPPALTIARHDGAVSTSPEYFILAPAGYPRIGPGTPGLMIMDRNGGIVWYSPNTGFPASKGEARMDLKVQTYRGKPVLTWWQGKVILKGVGEGRAVIADTSYRTIATLNAGNGLQVDLHEFVITPQDTALITANRPVATDLSAIGGPRKGVALSGVVQEIDIPTGKVLFEWSSLVGDQSYRAFTADWAGHPAGKPAAAARVNPAGGSVVYASWNGSTELDTWTVLAGQTPDGLAKAGSQRRAGFETMITVNTEGPYFAVTAEDAGGRALATSATVRLEK